MEFVQDLVSSVRLIKVFFVVACSVVSIRTQKLTLKLTLNTGGHMTLNPQNTK